MAKQISDENFNEEIKEGVTLVDFWAPWCGPCKMLEPVIEKLSEEYKGKINIVKLNTDENRETPEKYGIQGIPTMILFKDGQIEDRMVGAYPEAAIREVLDKHV